MVVEARRVERVALSRDRAFRRIWLATGVSALGTFVGMLAVAFAAVKTLGASSSGMALLGLVQLFAGMVAAPLAGLVGDRSDRRRVLVAADLVRATAIVTIPLAARLGVLSLPWLAAVGALNAAGGAAFNAAYAGFLPRLVGRDRLVRANALVASTVSLAEIAGFAAAGWLVQLLGAPNAQLVDAVSFVASALCLRSLRARPTATVATPPATATTAQARPSGWAEAMAGVRFVAHEPVLRALVGTAALYDAANAMVGVSYLLYLSGVVGFGEGELGTIFALGGLAALLGARLAARAERLGRVGASMAAAGGIRTLGMAAMPAAASAGLVGHGLLVANQLVTDPVWMLHEIGEASVRQARSPDRLAGRVAAAGQLASNSGRLAGTGLAWLVGTIAGPRASLWVAVGLCASAAALVAISPLARVERAVEA